MKPGFDSFQFIEKGELLAEDKSGAITAPIDGRIFMPLYQIAGDDGFFIVEEV
jgi:succinylglutamate desuccinylase